MKRPVRICIAALMLCVLLFAVCVPMSALAEETDKLARPSVNGILHVEGASLADESGNPVMLQGLSLHGLSWYPEYIDEDLFCRVSEEWSANLIRLPVYASQYEVCGAETSQSLAMLGIEYAVTADMYVLVDWHMLENGDPNENFSNAASFFIEIARRYGDLPNVIYEICNEPNSGATWEDISRYANALIPVIRAYDPDAVIVVGTPDYDRDLASVTAAPLTDYDNIMYTFHFYAASHYEDMFATLEDAVEAELPVFVTECGISEASGDGKLDYTNAGHWFAYLKEHNIPFSVWSLSNKDEASAMVKATVTRPGKITDDDLTGCGRAVKAFLLSDDPEATGAGLKDETASLLSLCRDHWDIVWVVLTGVAAAAMGCVLIGLSVRRKHKNRGEKHSYYDYVDVPKKSGRTAGKVFLVLSCITTPVYIIWRTVFSVPLDYGWAALVFNCILLAAEFVGFIESLIHYSAMLKLRECPMPFVKPEDLPAVDVFIATYNEPEELLRKTILGCKGMKYPDPEKVHIWVCDDKRRPSMRALAEELGVGYFDRPDNKGAKAGNLNHAMGLTSAPYIVTFDADMIPREDFLLKTMPYYADAEARGIPLALLQTPQCFYSEDVFQHNLYAEYNIPNEQDFFYRTIEPAKTASNSVIYGGSNTILSRKALEDIGGFFTGSITEDFATGLMLEARGYVSLGLPEPLASGLAPSSFEEHVQQRTRWGRGVILTAKKLKFLRNPNLSAEQKASYLGSVAYWFNPILNLVYLISPLLFAVFGIPIMRCTWVELVLFWLPMFITSNLCLRFMSRGSMSVKWSAIQEMCMTPFLLIPVLKESFGISLSTFKVTDKRQKAGKRKKNIRLIAPFAVFAVLYAVGIVRTLILLSNVRALGLFVLLYWLVRNFILILMSLFLVDGRDQDGENVRVKDAVPVTLRTEKGQTTDGITTLLTEHGMKVFPEEGAAFRLGESVEVGFAGSRGTYDLRGTVVEVRKSRNDRVPPVYTVEIMDFMGYRDDYVYDLYNRVPTLPQTLTRDLGILRYLIRNLFLHITGTGR